ncbi:MAG: SGNH/GDSL hydrolase family protein [Bacteroidales bacterium]
MKHYAFFIILLLCSFQLLRANQPADTIKNDTIAYTDALNYRLTGKGFHDTEDPYDRLPAGLKGKIREPLWNLSKNSSGMAVRFRTDSHFIAAKYELTMDRVMNHMAFTGIKGLDLYCLEEDGKWHYVMTARPRGKANQVMFVQNMVPAEREYMIYLPLYDGIKSLQIGVGKNSTITAGKVQSPAAGKPVVVYGTSITQGGCASRPGMAYTNILSRMLDKEVINLGFSGNGRLDIEIAQAMDQLDPSCIIIDCIPNCTLTEVEEKTAPFLRHLRQTHPDVPVVMVEGPYFPQQKYDMHLQRYLPSKNTAYRAVYDQLYAENPHCIHYVENKFLTGEDREGTVDGIHLTDLGFQRMAQALYPVVKPLVHETKVIAHRGYWDCPGSAQNSIFALKKAAEAGVYGSEFDVLITGDSVAVVNHDHTIDGIVITETPFRKLKNKKLKNGEKLPTLEAYLKAGKQYPDLKLILEIKPHPSVAQEERAVAEVVRLVKELGMEEQTEYISFSKYICDCLHRALPDAQVAVLTENVTPQQAAESGLTGVDYHYNVYNNNPDYRGYCDQAGLSTNVWTVNKPEVMQQFIDMHIDYITTDKPVEAKELILKSKR